MRASHEEAFKKKSVIKIQGKFMFQHVSTSLCCVCFDVELKSATTSWPVRRVQPVPNYSVDVACFWVCVVMCLLMQKHKYAVFMLDLQCQSKCPRWCGGKRLFRKIRFVMTANEPQA